MKKKLLTILGSGSSIPLGMPSVSHLNERMAQWGREWAQRPHCADYFEPLGKSIAAYYTSRVITDCPPITFEKILGEMLALSHWMMPSPLGDTLRQSVCPSSQFTGTVDHGLATGLRSEMSHLLSELARHMRSCSRNIECSGQSSRQYAALLQTLRDSFDVGVFNLNYDTGALTAMPGAYTGFTEHGKFEPHVVHTRATWDFVYHLHGSVHHSLVQKNSDEICWRKDLSEEFFDSDDGIAPKLRSDGRLFPVSTLLAGGFKLDQLLVEPFHSFHAALVRHMFEADAIFIGGYGFGDAHINWALRNSLGGLRNRPPIVVVDWREPGALLRNDTWATGFCAALKTDGTFFRNKGADTQCDGMLAGGTCQIASEHRIALLRNGFCEAASEAEEICDWLSM